MENIDIHEIINNNLTNAFYMHGMMYLCEDEMMKRNYLQNIQMCCIGAIHLAIFHDIKCEHRFYNYALDVYRANNDL